MLTYSDIIYGYSLNESKLIQDAFYFLSVGFIFSSRSASSKSTFFPVLKCFFYLLNPYFCHFSKISYVSCNKYYFRKSNFQEFKIQSYFSKFFIIFNLIQASLEFRGIDICGFEYSRFMITPKLLYGCPLI